MFRKILVAVDNGPPAARAVEMAVELAEQSGGRIGVLHAIDSSRAFHSDPAVFDERLMVELREEAERLVDSICTRIPTTLDVERLKGEGDPAQTILDTARQWKADVIVIGTDGRGRLSHFLLGSTADAVIRRSRCPVIAVRADAVLGASKIASMT